MRPAYHILCRSRVCRGSKISAIFVSIISMLIFLSIALLVRAKVDRDVLQRLATEAIQQAVAEAEATVQQRQAFQLVCERLMGPAGILQRRHHAFLPPSTESMANAEIASIAERATFLLVERTGASRAEIRQFDNEIDIVGTALDSKCPDRFQSLPKKLRCNITDDNIGRVRSIDGSCNNLRRPIWGAAGTAFARLIAPVYEDGVSSPRIRSKLSFGNGQLPSPRVVSVCTSPPIDKPHRSITLALVFLGQLIDHDLGLAPMVRVLNSAGERVPPVCCNAPSECIHPECMPISIPRDDLVYGRSGLTCMEFARSLPALRESCRLGYREQVNEPTHFLDGSAVYGSSRERLASVRAFRDGLMRVSDSRAAQQSGIGELPPAQNEDSECKVPAQQPSTTLSSDAPTPHCFRTGDPRVNEQPILTAFHVVMIREHNRIARALKRMAVEQQLPTSDDERLFQATRKIMIAFFQHIVYNEFLPAVLGNAIVRGGKNELHLCSSDDGNNTAISPSYCRNGYYTGYTDRVPPHVLQEFSTAAFRFGHTLLSDKLFRSNVTKPSQSRKQISDNENNFNILSNVKPQVNTTRLADNFFNPFLMFEKGAVGGFLYGCMLKNAEAYDSTIVPSVRDELFKERSTTNVGMDLLALNIQRARDHGIAGYNFYRTLCGLRTATNFNDLLDTMPADAVERLQCAYKHVDDIDLFPGGIAERPVNADDGVVGPTFACIIGQQFYQLKKGDRFWYENPGQFTPAQLAAIRRVTLARLFCDNTEIERAQPWILLQPLPIINAEVACAELRKVDLSLFVSLI